MHDHGSSVTKNKHVAGPLGAEQKFIQAFYPLILHLYVHAGDVEELDLAARGRCRIGRPRCGLVV